MFYQDAKLMITRTNDAKPPKTKVNAKVTITILPTIVFDGLRLVDACSTTSVFLLRLLGNVLHLFLSLRLYHKKSKKGWFYGKKVQSHISH